MFDTIDDDIEPRGWNPQKKCYEYPRRIDLMDALAWLLLIAGVCVAAGYAWHMQAAMGFGG